MAQIRLVEKSLRERMRESSNLVLAIDSLITGYAWAWNFMVDLVGKLIVSRRMPKPMVRTGLSGADNASRFHREMSRVVKETPRKPDDFQPTVFSMAQKREYAVSDRVQIVSLEIAPNTPVGRIWIYLFPDEKLAKPVFMVDDSQVREIVGVKRYYVAPVAWDPMDGEEGIDKLKHELAVQMQVMVRKKYEQYTRARNAGKNPHQELKLQAAKAVVMKQESEKKQKATAPRASVKQEAPVAPTPAAAPAVAVHEPAPVPAPAPAPAPVAALTPVHKAQVEAPAAERVQATPSGSVGRMAKGQSWTGYIAEMGIVDRPGSGGTTYKSYCLKLDVNGTHLPYYGVDLQRELMERRARPGDKVQLVFMGPMALPRGEGEKPMWKNLYKITVLEKGSAQ